MLKFIVKTLGIAAGLLLSCAVHAVGMGNINVTSALGEPLQAEIELVSVGKADKGNLAARMASPDVFKGAGIDYPSALPKLKFQVAVRANGAYYIKVSTAQPVNDPFVNMLVELSWSSGRLLREYTFLLDPPGFKAEEPKEPEVQPVLSQVEEPVEVAAKPARPEREEQPPMPAEHMESSMPMVGMPLRHGLEERAPEGGVAMGEIKVKRGDTLGRIAIENKVADVSLERMLVALYRANSDAFDGDNMNRLKTGKILRLPQASDLDAVEHAEAVKEVRAQAADWNAYRQKLAAASAAVPEQAPKQEVSGKISTSVADKAPPAKEGAQDVVKLSKGEAPGDAVAKDAQAKKQAQEEEAIAKSKALKESNERIAMLEKTNKEMQHLLELKKQAATPAPSEKPAPAQPPKAEEKPADSKVTAVPVEPAASGVSPAPAPAAKPAKPKKAPVVAPPPPPSMLDEILAEPLYLAGGAAVLLGLGGIAFMRARGGKGGKPIKAPKKETAANEEKVIDLDANFTAPASSSPDTGDFTVGALATAAAAGALESDVDPLSEADLFLNFGRDAQAEEILTDALQKNPANQQIRLKLLSIYANRNDTKSFSGIAREVQDSGDAVAWAQAAEMGRKLEPNNPMYGGTDGGAVVAAAPKEMPAVQTEQSGGLDFDLGFTEPEATSASAAIDVLDITQNSEVGGTTGLDFDLGTGGESAAPADTESTMLLTPLDESAVAAPETLDFDITGTSPNLAAQEPAPEEVSLDELVLDIPPAEEVAPAQSGADIALANDDTIAFSLDFPATPAEEPVATPVPESEPGLSGLGEISLDLEVPAAAPPAADETKDSRWHEVATKLDLARAYQEMGDSAGAREILEEVLRDGDERQRATAEAMMQQMSV